TRPTSSPRSASRPRRSASPPPLRRGRAPAAAITNELCAPPQGHTLTLASAHPAPPSRTVLRQYELVEKVRSYDPDADEGLINRAYVFSMKAHGDQQRASGDPYFSHPIDVAGILTDLKLDDQT